MASISSRWTLSCLASQRRETASRRAQGGARHAAGRAVDQGVGACPLQLERLERELRADIVDGDLFEGVHRLRFTRGTRSAMALDLGSATLKIHSGSRRRPYWRGNTGPD